MKGRRVTLRKVHDGDIEQRQRLGRHPEIARGFGIFLETPASISYEEAKTWVDDVAAQEMAWIIEYENYLIGLVRLDEINLDDLRCSLAIGIFDPTALDIGLGQETIKLCVTYAFEILKLHRISVRVLANNDRAIHCYRKCGFVEEGRERESALVNGQWVDDLIMGLLNN